MSRSSTQFPAPPALALTLLAVALVGFVPSCARRGTSSQLEPETAPTDTTRASELTSGEIEKRPQEPLASLLQSRASGVEVAMNGDGSISLRIRGAASFYAGTEPLIVVDGTPFTPGHGGTLRGINPHDIESIRVLKNPADTALYGLRGGNGVILVTTTRPRP